MASVSNGSEWRRRLWAAQGGICPYCGRPMPPRTGSWKRYSNLDHVYPRAREKWRGSVGNILLAHSACNLAKGDRMPTACEVVFLEAVNLAVGSLLRKKPGAPNKSPTGKIRWANLPPEIAAARRAQSDRSKMAARG